MSPLTLFLYLLALAGGLFCILAVIGLFWLLRYYVIGRAQTLPSRAEPVQKPIEVLPPVP